MSVRNAEVFTDHRVLASFRRTVDQATPAEPLTVTQSFYEAMVRRNPANAARYRVADDTDSRDP